MFQKLKYWVFGEKKLEESNSGILNFIEEENDPRELPRPGTITSDNLQASSTNITKGVAKSEQCNCSNCCEISDIFSECPICMEPLQCAAICSCMFCGNYICWICSEKVQHCPFCRMSFSARENRIRNFALERILSKLGLPCKYARWGCDVSLQHSNRSSHEESCVYAPPNCPLVGLCSWQGKTSDLTRHLKDMHDVTVHTANEIDIEIKNFFIKLIRAISTPRLYTISLRYLGNIFICRLTMHHLALRFVFFQITGDTAMKNQKYEAMIEIRNNSRVLTGAVKIFPKHKNNKEIVIPGRMILNSEKNADHLVKIAIIIKPVIS